MPSFLCVVDRQIATGKIEGNLSGLTFFHTDTLEALQQFGCWRYRCHLVADVELDDFVPVAWASVFDGARDFIEGVVFFISFRDAINRRIGIWIVRFVL